MMMIVSVLLGAFSAFLFIPWAVMVLAVALALSFFVLAPVAGVYLLRARDRHEFKLRTIADWKRRVLLVRGFGKDRSYTEEFRWGLTRAILAEPPFAGSVACSCIRGDGDQYLGVVRIGSRDGNFCMKVKADAPHAVASRMMENFDQLRGAFPVREGAPLDQDQDCNESVCPLGKKSLFNLQRERKARYWLPVPGLERSLVPVGMVELSGRYSRVD